MAYVDPQSVISPKNAIKDLRVIYDQGPTPQSWSVATLEWKDRPRVGLRWNGDSESSKGNPQSRGNPTWFIVPEELEDEVLRAVQKLRRSEEESLMEGYRAMAADSEREDEAEKWSEALIGDSSEAR